LIVIGSFLIFGVGPLLIGRWIHAGMNEDFGGWRP
jgi:hypothetical protein